MNDIEYTTEDISWSVSSLGEGADPEISLSIDGINISINPIDAKDIATTILSELGTDVHSCLLNLDMSGKCQTCDKILQKEERNENI